MSTVNPAVSANNTAEFFDHLFSLSPQVFEGPAGLAFVNLALVSNYWQLSTLNAALRPPAEVHGAWIYSLPSLPPDGLAVAEHPFTKKIGELHSRFGICFTLAPYSAWALWFAQNFAPTRALEFWDAESTQAALEFAPLNRAQDFIYDFLEKSADARGAFDDFCELCTELGLKFLGQLRGNESQDLAFHQRFGNLTLQLFKRLRAREDIPLHEYVAPTVLQEIFHPQLEQALSSDRNPDLLERVKLILENWEERLGARKILLCGLHVQVASSRQGSLQHFSFKLPRPSRSARLLFTLLQEQWLSHAGHLRFDDEVEFVRLQSLGLQPESDRQLSLFDPRREEMNDEWNLLAARVQARSTPAKPIRLGSYAPHDSFWPEKSIRWVEAGVKVADLSLPRIEDHPPRPHTLLREPQEISCPSFNDEAAFLTYLESHDALASLERIQEASVLCPNERSYARVGQQWLFWDHEQRRLFLHGYFEG